MTEAPQPLPWQIELQQSAALWRETMQPVDGVIAQLRQSLEPAKQLREAMRVALPSVDAIRALQAALQPQEQAFRAFQESMRPVQEAVAQFKRNVDAIYRQLEPLNDAFRWLAKRHAECDRLEAAGWLPHWSSPLHLLEATMTAEEVDEAVHAHYRDEWPELSDTLIAGVEGCDLDDEAKATFKEAIDAHRAGLYRCAPRLLYPEIERVARAELHDGALEGLASQRLLRELIGTMDAVDLPSSGVPALRFYRVMTDHLYAQLKDPDAVARAEANPIPNRHAALHGIVSYRSEKSSLNAIFTADYLLQTISVLKGYSARSPEDPALPG